MQDLLNRSKVGAESLNARFASGRGGRYQPQPPQLDVLPNGVIYENHSDFNPVRCNPHFRPRRYTS